MHDYYKISWQMGWNYFFLFLTFLTGFFATIFLTRNLSLFDYGVYSIFSTTLFVSITLLSGGVTKFIITRYTGLKAEDKNKRFFSIYLFQFLMISLISFILIFFRNNIVFMLKLPETYSFLVILTSFLILGGAMIDLNISYLMTCKRLVFSSFLMFVYSNLVFVMAFTYFFIFKDISLNMLFWVWLVSFFITVGLSFCYNYKNIFEYFSNFKFSLNAIKQAFTFSIPILPYMVGYWIIMASNRFILNYITSPEKVAIFSLIYSLFTIIFTIAFTINNVLYPYISESFIKKKQVDIFFNILLKYSLIIIIPLLIFFFVMGEAIIFMISGEKYLPGVALIPYLIIYPLLAFFVYYLSNHLLLRGKTKIMGFVFLLGAVVNIVLNFSLIPYFDYFGAAISTITSFALMLGLFIFFTFRYVHLDYKFLALFRILIAALISGSILAFFHPHSVTTKLLVLLFGSLIYIALLLILRVFNVAELNLLKKHIKNAKSLLNLRDLFIK